MRCICIDMCIDMDFGMADTVAMASGGEGSSHDGDGQRGWRVVVGAAV